MTHSADTLRTISLALVFVACISSMVALGRAPEDHDHPSWRAKIVAVGGLHPVLRGVWITCLLAALATFVGAQVIG